MSVAAEHLRTAPEPTKENRRMPKRLASLTALIGAVTMLLVLPVASAQAASPWWQVVTGSHPTNLWEPKPAELEIKTETAEVFEQDVLVAKIEVGGATVGCLGLKGGFNELLCEMFAGFAPTETAAELDSLLTDALVPKALRSPGAP